ncbi:hypothetical protein D1007_02629 [Hordeum vulgare]|nr:hypothetical protein D1007_02629 [Hordeum vulgare]
MARHGGGVLKVWRLRRGGGDVLCRRRRHCPEHEMEEDVATILSRTNHHVQELRKHRISSPRNKSMGFATTSVPAMRYTDSIYQDEFGLEDSANILSVSIVSSDVGFPLNVYGRVIARDSIDYKCIYLFHRSRDDCQRLNEDGMLTLTGPSRGLVFVDFIYLEMDLKIREDGVFPDRAFSKGVISIDGRVLSREEDVVVTSETLESWLSTTEVRFATVLNAVECTIEIKLLEGCFSGNIIVGISDKDRNLDTEQTIVIHNSKTDGMVTSDQCGAIKLRRSVITICLERMLVFHMNNNMAVGVSHE